MKTLIDDLDTILRLRILQDSKMDEYACQILGRLAQSKKVSIDEAGVIVEGGKNVKAGRYYLFEATEAYD